MQGTEERYQLSADLGWVELWCNRCGADVRHDFYVTTARAMEQRLDGKWYPARRVSGLVAECDEGHRQTIL